MKKQFYFVQPNTMLGNSVYLPYAAGVISSYALQFEDLNGQYELGGIIFKEDPAETAIGSISSPFLVGFSCYFWNYQYNLRLAEKLKKLYPDCVIVFGGHQIPRNTEFLEKYDFIDILIFGEGEIPFSRILRNLANEQPLENVPNIAFRSGSDIVKTEDVCEGIEDYPSPYLNGTFDKLLNVPEGLEFNAQLETNRGCPYHCSFCDWCDYDIPMRKFPLERIYADLQWISDRKIAYCMCVDSNFGLFDRDEEIAQYAVSLKERSGYPEKFSACFAKDKTDRIFRINKLLNGAGMSKGVSLAFQSMSGEVLENISRKNMNNDKLSAQLELYHKEGIPTYTELILGLPGETLKSFSEGICELLERGQHDSINVFRCEVYPNSTLANAEYMKKFGIKTAINRLNVNHCKLSNAVFAGGLEYIVETDTMTAEEMVRATVFSSVIQSVHCHGLLQCAAIYLHDSLHVSYYDFYEKFISRFENREGVIGDEMRTIAGCIRSVANGETDTSYLKPELFGDITWPYEEAMLIDFIYRLDDFYGEAREFLESFPVDGRVLDDLMKYQKNMIVVPGENDITEEFDHDWHSYFTSVFANAPQELRAEKSDCRFYAEGVPADWENYAKKIIWYGRRNKKTIRNIERL